MFPHLPYITCAGPVRRKRSTGPVAERHHQEKRPLGAMFCRCIRTALADVCRSTGGSDRTFLKGSTRPYTALVPLNSSSASRLHRHSVWGRYSRSQASFSWQVSHSTPSRTKTDHQKQIHKVYLMGNYLHLKIELVALFFYLVLPCSLLLGLSLI